MSYPFIKHDGGRSVSTHPKERNDCTVRALALVTAPQLGGLGAHYDDVYRLLKDAGSRATNSGVGFDRFMYGHLDPVIGEPQTVFGWTARTNPTSGSIPCIWFGVTTRCSAVSP